MESRDDRGGLVMAEPATSVWWTSSSLFRENGGAACPVRESIAQTLEAAGCAKGAHVLAPRSVAVGTLRCARQSRTARRARPRRQSMRRCTVRPEHPRVVVDDDEDIRRLLKTVLSEKGDVTEAATGEAALAAGKFGETRRYPLDAMLRGSWIRLPPNQGRRCAVTSDRDGQRDLRGWRFAEDLESCRVATFSRSRSGSGTDRRRRADAPEPRARRRVEQAEVRNPPPKRRLPCRGHRRGDDSREAIQSSSASAQLHYHLDFTGGARISSKPSGA